MFKRVSISLGLAILISVSALAQQPVYEPYYNDVSERSYSEANKPLAEEILEHFKKWEFHDVVKKSDALLSRADLNPYEISNTNLFKAHGYTRLTNGNYQDRLRAPEYRQKALDAYAAAVDARGFMELSLQTKSDIDKLLKQIGDEENYGKFKFHHQAIYVEPTIIPDAFLDSEYSGTCGVRFALKDSGKPKDVKATCSDPVLYKAAVKTIKNWRFKSVEDDPYGLRRDRVFRRLHFILTDENGKPRPAMSVPTLSKYR